MRLSNNQLTPKFKELTISELRRIVFLCEKHIEKKEKKNGIIYKQHYKNLQ